MRRLLKDWGVSIVVGILVFLMVQWVTYPRSSGLAPDFTLDNVAGGTVSLEKLQGKTVVLNFWGSWCGPCRAEIPELAAWHTEHPEVELIGIAVKSGQASTVAQKSKQLGINYTVVLGDEAVLDAYGIHVFPTTVVVSPEGKILSVETGALGKRELDALVQKNNSPL
jgi:cytochrome c biogenesis protein CcmG/thiol:disulfide interchange protein DsbE